MAIVHILCTHSDYPTRINTVIALQLSHRDCHIANVAFKPSYHDCHIATDASHCTSRLSLNALHIAMVASISSHSRPFSSIYTSLSSNLHHRLARPPGPPYSCHEVDSSSDAQVAAAVCTLYGRLGRRELCSSLSSYKLYAVCTKRDACLSVATDWLCICKSIRYEV